MNTQYSTFTDDHMQISLPSWWSPLQAQLSGHPGPSIKCRLLETMWHILNAWLTGCLYSPIAALKVLFSTGSSCALTFAECAAVMWPPHPRTPPLLDLQQLPAESNSNTFCRSWECRARSLNHVCVNQIRRLWVNESTRRALSVPAAALHPICTFFTVKYQLIAVKLLYIKVELSCFNLAAYLSRFCQ